MNILVIKKSALGDVMRTSFIAQALKDKYKNPRIYWLTDKKSEYLFINNPYIDKVILSENQKTLKKIPFDLIVNLEEGEDDCKLAMNLISKKLIGFIFKNNEFAATPTAREWFDMSRLGKKPENDILKKANKKTHRQIISEIVGIRNFEKYEPFLRLNREQRKIANDFLRRHNLSRTDLIIGINTGSADTWPKQISTKKAIQLIEKLYFKFNAKILLFGGPTEQERNQEIQKSSKSPIIDTGCGNNLIEFPALISVCNLLITSDSLGLHVSLALKRNTIVLIGPTSPNEIDMYGIGEKVIAKSDCVSCYKRDCKSIEKIDINEIISKTEKSLFKKITLLITAFDEPNFRKTLESAINQKTKFEYDIVVSAPDEETLNIVKEYSNDKITTIKDLGMGKSLALNLAFSRINSDILILTDGDVYLSENAVEELTNSFLDPEVGCVSGRPVPQESKNTKYGFWAHFLFDAAHKIRKKAFKTSAFIECSGYLFAFRKQRIKKIPVDVAEDTIIPYLLWQKGYKIGYAENAQVYVKNANNWNDWLRQKTRTHKSHTKLSFYVDTKTNPRVKTFNNEAKGIFQLMHYPQNFKELLWSEQLLVSRLITWAKYFIDTRFLERNYRDGWERIESTK